MGATPLAGQAPEQARGEDPAAEIAPVESAFEHRRIELFEWPRPLLFHPKRRRLDRGLRVA